MSNYDNYKELALDLTLDVKVCHERINQLERALAKANNTAFRLRGSYRPLYDEEADFSWCPKCGEEFRDVPNYCPTCGIHFSFDSEVDE